MSTFFIMLSSICFIIMIIGIIKPSLVIRWGEKKTRLRALLIFGGLMVGFAVLGSALMSPEEKQAMEERTKIEQQQKAEQNEKNAIAKKEKEISDKNASEKLKQAQKQADQQADQQAQQELIKFIKENRLNKSAIEQFKKANNFNDDELLNYYKEIKLSNKKAESEINKFRNEIKDIDAKAAALNEETREHYRNVKNRISISLQEKSDKTLFGGQFKTDVILTNKKSSLFSSDYEIKKVYVYLVLKDPLFGMIVHAEKLSFKGIEPGETGVEEITTKFANLKVANPISMIVPIKADKKGVIYDSEVFSL